jgi:hypothetical protein
VEEEMFNYNYWFVSLIDSGQKIRYFIKIIAVNCYPSGITRAPLHILRLSQLLGRHIDCVPPTQQCSVSYSLLTSRVASQQKQTYT